MTSRASVSVPPAEAARSTWTKRTATLTFFLGVGVALLISAWRDSSSRTLSSSPRASGASRIGSGRGRPSTLPVPAALSASEAVPCPACPLPPPPPASGSALSVTDAVARLYSPAGMHPRDGPAALEASRLAPLTHEAAKFLWERQNPDDCAGAQYLVSLGHVKGNGIGSLMHVTGYHFAVAIEEGRVFLFGENSGVEWTDASTCGKARNWECFFRPPSRCGRENLKPGNYVECVLAARCAGCCCCLARIRLLRSLHRAGPPHFFCCHPPPLLPSPPAPSNLFAPAVAGWRCTTHRAG